MEKMTQLSQEQNRTILFVSHNLLAIKQLSKKVLLLDQGVIKMSGEAQQVIDFYNHQKSAKGQIINLFDIKRSGYVGDLIFEKIEFSKPIFEFGEDISFRLTVFKTIIDSIDFDLV